MHDERRHDEVALPAELTALEERLKEFLPAAPQLDRDRLMFAAGAASAQPERLGYIAEPSRFGERFWQAAASVMTAATLLLAAMLLRQTSSPEQFANTTRIDDPPLAATGGEPSPAEWSSLPPDRIPSGYLGVRYVALTQGIGALDDEQPSTDTSIESPSQPATSRELLREYLPANVNPRS